MRRIILASASPRRKEILGIFIPDFDCVVADVDETTEEGMPPADTVMTLAQRKARAVAGRYPDALVIGSDTIVCCGGEILGKPRDTEDAGRMLELLSGNIHSVFSGVAVLCGGREYVSYEETKVKMREIAEDEKEAYLLSGEGADKAGAYGIQGMACAFIEKIDGSYHNVMGLPVYTLCALMREAGERLI